jgi:16S rRNA (cytidine1402-2'-O)-methyltransferase
MSGALVLVSTPIGNLGDLPPRAVATLAGASAICCEDTRRTGRLLQHAGIADVPLVLLNEHTELARVREVLDLLGQGGDVALVTDAGTPGISDPGERLVRAVIDAGHAVSAVPGPAALVMALVLSGLPTGRFVFEGFLPRKGRERDDRLRELATERRTIVLYESPHRLARTLGDLAEHLGGERRMAIARELTKLHEEIWHGTVDEAIRRTAALPTDPLGEHVLVVEGAPEQAPADDDTIRAALRQAMAAGLDRKSAVGEVTKRLRAHKRDVYAISLTLET